MVLSLPLAFTTVEQDSMLLVDGGLLNNLPVDVARRMGADYVIAIDLMDAKRATQQSRGTMHTRGLASILEWKYVRPDLDKYQVNRRDADVLIHPDVEGYHGASFSEDDTRQLIARGEEAGRAALDKLAEIRQRVQPEQKGKGSKGSGRMAASSISSTGNAGRAPWVNSSSGWSITTFGARCKCSAIC